MPAINFTLTLLAVLSGIAKIGAIPSGGGDLLGGLTGGGHDSEPDSSQALQNSGLSYHPAIQILCHLVCPPNDGETDEDGTDEDGNGDDSTSDLPDEESAPGAPGAT